MKIIDFLFNIEKTSKIHINIQIYENVKRLILDGMYKYGDKLPSVRLASQKLSVSKSSIIAAYLQLCTEGYIENVPCKGYFVCKVSGIEKENLSLDFEFKEENLVYINDSIAKDAVPLDIWKKTYKRVLLDNNLDITIQGDEQGEYELRKAIADYVRVTRGCDVNASQVVISGGVQNLISLLIKTCKGLYDYVFLESPGYKKVEYIFEDFNYPIKKIPVSENGIKIDYLENRRNSIVYTSPSYQYPLGNLMSVEKRIELIKYANENNCLIIEDDYAGNIRYDSKPISSLQGMDSYGNTVYLGSFSKTFLPSMRISFMVIPKKILPNYYMIKARYTHNCSKIEQLCLARIISEGYMEKHIRKINNIYKMKNKIISSYIKERYKNRLKVHNNQSGFHIILSCKTTRDIGFLDDLKNEFLRIEIIDFTNGKLLFLFGFSGLTNEEIPDIIDKMAEVLGI